MAENLSSNTVIIIILFVIVGFFVLIRCKLSCSQKEGLSHYPSDSSKDESYQNRENNLDMHTCDYMCKEHVEKESYNKCIKRCQNLPPCTTENDCMFGECLGIRSKTDKYCINHIDKAVFRPLRREEAVRHYDDKPRTCPSEFFFNEVVGNCEPRFQGSSSAAAVNLNCFEPSYIGITLPGSTMLEYGVGYTDPENNPTPYYLS